MIYISYDQIDEASGAITTTPRQPIAISFDGPTGGYIAPPNDLDLEADGDTEENASHPPVGQNIINLPAGYENKRIRVLRNEKYLPKALWSKSGLVLTLVDEIDDDETFTIIQY